MIVLQRVRVPWKPCETVTRLRSGRSCPLRHRRIYVTNHLANGIDDVGQIQIARCDLVQHRGEEKEVLAVYDSHFESRIAALFKLQRGIKAAKPPPRMRTRVFLSTHIAEQRSYGENTPCARGDSSSPNDHAWNGQPRGVCGGSASQISEMWPSPASFRCSIKGRKKSGSRFFFCRVSVDRGRAPTPQQMGR